MPIPIKSTATDTAFMFFILIRKLQASVSFVYSNVLFAMALAALFALVVPNLGLVKPLLADHMTSGPGRSPHSEVQP